MMTLVLAPGHLRGACVEHVKTDETGTWFILDRRGFQRDRIVVGEDYVQIAPVMPCCHAAEDAPAAEQLYAAYNLGGPVERAGLSWNGQPVPTWAELQTRAAAGDVGAAGVIAKWEATAETSQTRVFPLPQTFGFGGVLAALNAGRKVCRSGWNGKGMFLSLTPGATIPAEKFWSPHNRAHAEAQGGQAEVLGSVSLKMADGKIMMGWTPNTADLLADDWMVV